MNRRKFIGAGLTGFAGMIAVKPEMVGFRPPEKETIFRTLGRTGMKVPVISMGVANTDSDGLCRAAYENGIRLFDTAHKYMNGRNEEMLGKVLGAYPRDSFIVSTKVYPADEEKFLQQFNMSLRRLGMDHVDILLMHEISTPEMVGDRTMLAIMKKLKKKGKARFIGFSTHRNMAECIKASLVKNEWDVILTSYNFKIPNIEDLNSALRKANEAGTGIIAMKPLAGGGWLDREKTKPVNTSAALKWALSNPDVHTAIPGMTNFDHLSVNIRLMHDLNMSTKEKQDLLLAQAETGMFCSGCGKCISSCPARLPLPDLMRAYMYAFGYSDITKAKQLIDTHLLFNPCQSCNACNVTCTMKFNVKEKITELLNLDSQEFIPNPIAVKPGIVLLAK